METRIRYFSIENFYPTPCKRIENPKQCVYGVGDIVEVLIGPAIGRLGRVVVDRNGNYSDSEPDSNDEGVAVAVVERMEHPEQLEKLIDGLTDHESPVHTIVRWFDGEVINDQLKLVRKDKK